MNKSSGAVDLVYTDTGHGEPVFLLHGLGSRGSDWQLQLPALSESFRVVVPDLRGHGTSPKPPGPYSVALMAADVMALMDKLGLPSAHFIGLSMGGMMAFQLAAASPERVRSAVIVNSAPELVPHSFRQQLQIWQRLTLARLTQPSQTGKFLSQRLFPKPEQEALRQRFVAEWSENDKAAYLTSMKALVGWSVLDKVGAITCPILVISGDRDYTAVEAKQAFVDKIPGARLVVIADSGHATPLDQPEEFNRTVLTFLQQVTAGQAATTTPA